jgi:antitoxin (DNA-binding transcriptional repressor) of toxin-antitoxin stability system
MKSVTIHDAKTNLSRYIAAAKRGEQIFIGNRGEPEIELVYHKPLNNTKVYRKLGGLKGKIWIAPDAFSRETDEKIAKQLYGHQ